MSACRYNFPLHFQHLQPLRGTQKIAGEARRGREEDTPRHTHLRPEATERLALTSHAAPAPLPGATSFRLQTTHTSPTRECSREKTCSETRPDLHRELAQGGLSHTGGGMQGHQPLSASQGGCSHSCWEARPTGRPRAAPAALELCGLSLEPRAVEFPSAPRPPLSTQLSLTPASPIREPKRRPRKWTEAPQLPTAPVRPLGTEPGAFCPAPSS